MFQKCLNYAVLIFCLKLSSQVGFPSGFASYASSAGKNDI